MRNSIIKFCLYLSILIATFSFANELNEIESESSKIYISDKSKSLYENIIEVDLNKNEKLFKKSLQTKLKNVNEINHYLENVYEINKNTLLFLITSNTRDNSCHVCIPKMSWYKLKLENNKWNIKSKILSVEPHDGSWGSFPIPEMIFIGKDKIAFKYISSYGGQGVMETHLEIVELDNINFKFNSILSLDYGFSDSGVYEENEEHNNWEGSIFIVKKDKPYYDILITKKGKKDMKKYEENKIYKYQNGKYIIDKD
jgi:hypothetical protein